MRSLMKDDASTPSLRGGEASDTLVMPDAVNETGIQPRPEMQSIKRRRAPRACLSCRARKVRCNVSENDTPCTNCRLDNLQCVVKQNKRLRTQKFRIHCFIPARGPDNSALTNVGMNIQPEEARGSTMPTGSTFAVAPNTSKRPSTEEDPRYTKMQRPSQSSDPTQISEHNQSLTSLAIVPYQITTGATVITNRSLPAYITPFEKHVTKEDLGFLRQKGALCIPNLELRNALFQGFVEFVYCFMPFLDVGEFAKIIDQEDGQHGQVGMLLFQAVMFAGSAFVEMKHLTNAGYKSRRAARKALFDKVRHLYDVEVDICTVSKIQALLLMTYFFRRPNEKKDLWYWMGIVVKLALSAELHRSAHGRSADLHEQKMRKRLWWSIFMREHMIALAMRRAPRISNTDHDILDLTLDDFDCDPIPSTIRALSPSCTVVRDVYQRRRLAVMCIEKAKLCVCIDLVLATRYTDSKADNSKLSLMLSPRQFHAASHQVRQCLEELANWNQCLPRFCAYDSTSSLLHCESPVMIVHQAILRMTYLTTLSAVYSPQILPFAPWSVLTSPMHGICPVIVDPAQYATRSCAGEISVIAEDLQQLGLARFMPTTVVTALLPAMMVHLLEMGSVSGPPSRGLHFFGKCMGLMHMLNETYASAEFAIEFISEAALDANVPFTLPPSSISGTSLITRDSIQERIVEETANGASDSTASPGTATAGYRPDSQRQAPTPADTSTTDAQAMTTVVGSRDQDPDFDLFDLAWDGEETSAVPLPLPVIQGQTYLNPTAPDLEFADENRGQAGRLGNSDRQLQGLQFNWSFNDGVTSPSFRHVDKDSHYMSPDSASLPPLADESIPGYYDACPGSTPDDHVREDDVWDFGSDPIVDYDSIFTGMSDEPFHLFAMSSGMIEPS